MSKTLILFRMFGQLLEKSIFLPKAEISTCKEETRHHPSAWGEHKLHVGQPNETRHHEYSGWTQTPHRTPQHGRTWDTEGACTLPYHIRHFSNNSQSKSSIPRLTADNDRSRRAESPWEDGFSEQQLQPPPNCLTRGCSNPQTPHTIIAWQKDVPCSHSSLPASLLKVFWLLVRKWVCLALPFSPSPFWLWGLVRKLFSCSYTSTASISWGPYGKKGCLSSPGAARFIR